MLRRGGLPRVARLGRLLVWPAVLMGLLLAYAGGGAALPAMTPQNWSHAPPQAVPLAPQTLEYLLGSGMPPLGLSRPVRSPLGTTGARIAAFLDYTFLGIAPHSPETLFGSAFAGFAFSGRASPPSGQSLGQWLRRIDPSAQPSAPRSGSHEILYGKGAPLVAIYATEGLGAYTGQALASQAPPPVSRDRSDNAIGLAQGLAKALGKAGVPTLFADVVNDGEGELGAYLKSAQTARAVLRDAPSVGLVLDVERPAFPPGPALRSLGGKKVAAIAIVVGTADRLPNPRWKDNLALARRLGVYLTQAAPGVFTGIAQSPDRLNQQYAATMLTLDIGGPQATPAQARRAIPLVVRAITAFFGQDATP